jgi:hypothetical protein
MVRTTMSAEIAELARTAAACAQRAADRAATVAEAAQLIADSLHEEGFEQTADDARVANDPDRGAGATE